MHAGLVTVTLLINLQINKQITGRWVPPVDALSSQAGSGQDLLDVSQPVGSLQFAQPAVHVMRLVIAGLH